MTNVNYNLHQSLIKLLVLVCCAIGGKLEETFWTLNLHHLLL